MREFQEIHMQVLSSFDILWRESVPFHRILEWTNQRNDEHVEQIFGTPSFRWC